VLDTYTYVEGTSLVGLIVEVRDEFWARMPYELDDCRTINSIRVVAVDVFDDKSIDDRLAVLRDLIEGNAELFLRRKPQEVFAQSDSPEAYVTDLVCEVVRQVLLRDPAALAEDQRRVALATESLDELEDPS
jgi:hypothetical protein